MILGIGNDIIEIARIKGILERYQKRFLDRVFTSHEQAYCLSRREPSLHLAGRFAAKEASVKALGTGFTQGITWQDLEIRNMPEGKPYLLLSHRLQERLGSTTILISISHCDQYATAFAIWTQSEKCSFKN